MNLTLTGSNFGPGDQVLVNGSPYTPSNITPTQLLLSLPDQAAGSVLTVVVKAPSGATSNQQSVTVKGPSPTSQGSGPLAIAGLAVIPNPNPRYLALDLAGPADSVRVGVYTKALVLALQFSRNNLSAGWNSFALPSEWASLGSGMYYVQVSATRGQAVSAPRFAKALVLR